MLVSTQEARHQQTIECAESESGIHENNIWETECSESESGTDEKNIWEIEGTKVQLMQVIPNTQMCWKLNIYWCLSSHKRPIISKAMNVKKVELIENNARKFQYESQTSLHIWMRWNWC